MTKNESQLQARRIFIGEKIIEAQKQGIKTDAIVQELSDQLFLCRAQIYRDFSYYNSSPSKDTSNRY